MLYGKGESTEKLAKIGNTACFRGVDGLPENSYIYIYNFERDLTYKYIKPLLRIINKITPCRLIKLKGTSYISFKLLGSYTKNLILLNFIRNLWHSPKIPYGNTQVLYSIIFFNELMKCRLKDPIRKLTHCNYIACKKIGFPLFLGHSNCYIPSLMKEYNTLDNFLKHNTSADSFFKI